MRRRTNPVVNHYIRSKIERANIGLKGNPLPALTVPGLYTLVYSTKEGEVLCADCAAERVQAYLRDRRRVRAGHAPDPYLDPVPISMDTYDEGSTIQCDGCGHMLKPSYGDPERSDEENELEWDTRCDCVNCRQYPQMYP